jgi:hypothetical protein
MSDIPPDIVFEATLTTERIRIEQHSATGLLWFAGWLFTIGLLHLSFWKGLLGLIVWPFFVGSQLATLVKL